MPLNGSRTSLLTLRDPNQQINVSNLMSFTQLLGHDTSFSLLATFVAKWAEQYGVQTSGSVPVALIPAVELQKIVDDFAFGSKIQRDQAAFVKRIADACFTDEERLIGIVALRELDRVLLQKTRAATSIPAPTAPGNGAYVEDLSEEPSDAPRKAKLSSSKKRPAARSARVAAALPPPRPVTTKRITRSKGISLPDPPPPPPPSSTVTKRKRSDPEDEESAPVAGSSRAVKKARIVEAPKKAPPKAPAVAGRQLIQRKEEAARLSTPRAGPVGPSENIASGSGIVSHGRPTWNDHDRLRLITMSEVPNSRWIMVPGMETENENREVNTTGENFSDCSNDGSEDGRSD